MFDLKSVVDARKSVIEDIQKLKSELDILDQAIIDHYHEEYRTSLFKKDEPFGTVNIEDNGYKITFNTPKKVKWDQAALDKLFWEIKNDGADPYEYMDVKYNVSETAYKAWPSSIADAFEPARTVEEGAVSLKIEEREDAFKS